MAQEESIGRVKVEVIPDAAGFKKKAEQQLKVQDLGPIKVTLDPTIVADLGKLNARMESIAKSLAKFVSITVDLNDATAAVIRGQLDEIARDRTAKVEAEIDSVSKKATEASLAFLTRSRTVTVSIRAGRSLTEIAQVLSGFTALRQSIEQSRRLFAGMFTNLPQVSAATLGIFQLSGALVSAAANMAGLAGSALQALPALLAIGGIAVGMGITAAAFKDFGDVLPGVVDQFSNLQDVISAAFWAPGTGAAAGIKAAAAALVGPLNSGLKSSAAAIGSFFGSLGRTVGEALGGAGGPLSTWFTQLTASVNAFKPFIGSIVSIFKQFGDVGAASLVPLANLVGSLADRFAKFFSNLVSSSGGVQAFADRSVAALGGIIETVIQIGRILGSVFSAAEESGAATFTSLAKGLSVVAETVDRNKATLVGLFNAASEMWSNFGATAGDSLEQAMRNVATLLTAVLPLVGVITGTLVGAFAGIITPEAIAGIQAFVAGIGEGVAALVPALAPLGNLIGALGPTLGLLATQIGTAFGLVAPSIDGVVASLNPLIAILGDSLAKILQSLSPLLDGVAKSLSEALASPALKVAIVEIRDAIIALLPVVAKIAEGFIETFVAILPVISEVAIAVAALAPALGSIVSFLTPMAPAILGVVVAWKAYTAALEFQKWLEALTLSENKVVAWAAKHVLAAVNTTTSWVSNQAKMLAATVATGLGMAASAVTSGAQYALAWVVSSARTLASLAVTAAGFIAHSAVMLATMAATAAGVVAGWVLMAVQSLIQAARMAAAWLIAMGPVGIIIAIVIALVALIIANWETIKEFTVKVFTAVVDFLRGVWDGIVNGIKAALQFLVDAFTMYFNIYKTIVMTVWNAIVSIFTTVLPAIIKFVMDGLRAIGQFFVDAFNSYVRMVQVGWDFIVGIFVGAWNGLTSVVSKGWAAITDFFLGAWNGLTQIVSDGWNAVKEFFSNGISNAIDLVRNLPGKIVSVLGNLGSTLFNAGKDLIQGLMDGIRSMASKIGSFFLNLLPGWIVGPFKAALGIHSPSRLFAGLGENIGQGLVNGIESMESGVQRAMNSLADIVAETPFQMSDVQTGASASLSAANHAIGTGEAGSGTVVNKTLVYNAAPGSSIDSQEDLFAAAGRARMGW